MYKKLTKNDIEILHEGQQIKRAVMKKFGSVEEFAKAGNVFLSLDTINNYLRRSKIDSDKFKYRLTIAFMQGYDEFVKTPEQQMKMFTDDIYTHITDYHDEEDINVIDKLKTLCEEYSLKFELAKTHLIIGMYYRQRNEFGKAYSHLQIAEGELQLRNANQLLVSLYAEQAVTYFYAKEYKNAERLYSKIEMRIADCSELDNRALFNYLYYIGILYNNNSKHELAHGFFLKALEYANAGLEHGSVVMNIGLSWKRRGEYHKAIEYYKQALAEFSEVEDISKCVIYNNLAEIYKILKDYDSAISNTKRAFELIGNNKNSFYFMINLTYVQILNDMGNIDFQSDEIDNLLDMIKSSEQYKLQKKYIIECLEYLFTVACNNKNFEFMVELSKLIAFLIRKGYNDEYTKELKTIYADIHLSME